MSKPENPLRKKALEMWFQSGRTMKPKEIADKLGINNGTVRKWKSVYKWDEKPDPRRGAPKGNRNAKGNKGGGAPPNNDNAVTHGMFRKFLPEDEETLQIFDATAELSPLEMLWTNIRILATNILRSQKITFVRDKDDETKVLKRQKDMNNGWEKEWDIQHAHDKQNAALGQQSAAMARLSSMIKQYEEMLRLTPPDEVRAEQRMRVDKLKIEIKAAEMKGF